MWLRGVVNCETLPVLEKLAAFTEARHQVLAENIANIDTPHYRAKQLDAKAFRAKLAEAVKNRRDAGHGSGLDLKGTRQFHVDKTGMLRVTPTLRPTENALFHDGTNASLERQMASLAENTLMNRVTVELLSERFRSLRKAISGRV